MIVKIKNMNSFILSFMADKNGVYEGRSRDKQIKGFYINYDMVWNKNNYAVNCLQLLGCSFTPLSATHFRPIALL